MTGTIRQEIFKKAVDSDKVTYTQENENRDAFVSQQGAKSATRETTPVAWDDTTTANVIYLKYPDGVIGKVNQTAKTITYNIGGAWADRATLTYTEWGA